MLSSKSVCPWSLPTTAEESDAATNSGYESPQQKQRAVNNVQPPNQQRINSLLCPTTVQLLLWRRRRWQASVAGQGWCDASETQPGHARRRGGWNT